MLLYFTYFLLYKSNKTIWMFYGKFIDKGDNSVDNTNIYNVEGDNRLSPSLQPLTSRSIENPWCFFSVRFCNCIFYTRNYFVVYFKTKQWSFKHLWVLIKQLLPSYEVNIMLSSLGLKPSWKHAPSGWQLSMSTSYEGHTCIMWTQMTMIDRKLWQ